MVTTNSFSIVGHVSRNKSLGRHEMIYPLLNWACADNPDRLAVP